MEHAFWPSQYAVKIQSVGRHRRRWCILAWLVRVQSPPAVIQINSLPSDLGDTCYRPGVTLPQHPSAHRVLERTKQGKFLLPAPTASGKVIEGEQFMRSDLIFGALTHVTNRYQLCQLASKATRKLHKPNTRLQDTTNEVLDRFKDTVPMDDAPEAKVEKIAVEDRQERRAA
jgi:hypothetical protein